MLIERQYVFDIDFKTPLEVFSNGTQYFIWSMAQSLIFVCFFFSLLITRINQS